MLHNIFGDVGAGKSAFLMRAIEKLYYKRGQQIWDYSKRKIEEENKKRKRKLTPPDRVPIYSTFDFEIPNLDGSVYHPYLIKGKDIGIGKKYKKLYPGAVIVLDEAQNDFNAKDVLPRMVSEFFEKHRHADFEIWVASQRPVLINKDIRDISRHFIQIYKLEMTKAAFGIITHLKWHCREFDSRADVDEYVELSKHDKGDSVSYKETVYESGGSILNHYNSKGLITDFLPAEGEDYVS